MLSIKKIGSHYDHPVHVVLFYPHEQFWLGFCSYEMIRLKLHYLLTFVCDGSKIRHNWFGITQCVADVISKLPSWWITPLWYHAHL